MKMIKMFIGVLWVFQSANGIPEARASYFRSSTKKGAQEFEQMMDKVGENASPLLICYKGAAEMLRAKGSNNPFTKLGYFQRGKSWVELGLSRDESSIEAHFIRFSIQQNLPDFLGYNNLKEDSLFIARGLPGLEDADLKDKINDYLKRHKRGN